jgi:putative hydrolase of the HAD superfamily
MNTPVIKGIIFDYGGTIDTNGCHWAEIFRTQYQTAKIGVTNEIFREAYKHAERTLALNPIIRPEFNFLDTLKAKILIQLEFLVNQGHLAGDDIGALSENMAQDCYAFVVSTVEQARPVLETLAEKYPLALVSNFYGNLPTVLKDLQISHCFKHLVESAVAGVRKPDPAIFTMGVELLGFDAANVIVTGDSYSKDIVPAKAAGCKTIWLKGQEWEATTVCDDADYIIYNLKEILNILINN